MKQYKYSCYEDHVAIYAFDQGLLPYRCLEYLDHSPEF